MADIPTLSVVIVSHECREHLLTCLGDLDAARAVIDLEVLVVDNASTDGSVEAVRRRFPWVDLDAEDQNLGFAKANNRAIRRARGPFVLILNPDTRVTPEALTACVAELRRRPDVGILTPRILDADGRFDRRCIRGFPTVWSVACHVTGADRVLRGPRSRRYTQGWLSETAPAEVEAVSGAVMFCRADALATVGGFDERFFMYGEDIDLCLRVHAAGWRVVYWPGAAITHIGGGAGSNPRSRAAWARSIGEINRRHPSGWRACVIGAVCNSAGALLGATRGHRRSRDAGYTGSR